MLLVFRAPEGPAVRPGCFVGPGRCVCRWAAARPRDRHTRACGSEWSISRPALALPPPTGTAARPRRPCGDLHTGGAWSLMCGWVRRLEARPDPAVAHGRRSQALRSLLIGGLPACLLVAPRVFRAPSGPAAREIATREPAARSGRSRSPPVPSGPSGALHTSGAWCADVVRHVCLKPSSPLLAGTCVGVKPASPLRVRNGCFWRGFRLHW